MSLTHLLDTSVYSQPLKRLPLPSVIKKWEYIGDQSLCISIFCETEVLQGLEMKGSERLWYAYKSILKDRIPIIPFDIKSAKIYASLQSEFIKKGKVRPIFDLLIASAAIAHYLILATCNYKDFCEIPDLRIEDWSAQKV